ncbi:MAG: hypothetical protein K2Z80_33505 [Xanthobacteraceae bacterium]|nr:hypothetical protein [Xanthobacteraceae bacterium]
MIGHHAELQQILRHPAGAKDGHPASSVLDALGFVACRDDDRQPQQLRATGLN